MAAAIDIIHASLFKIGVHSEIKPVSNEMLTFSFTKFQGFIKKLRDKGYNSIGEVVPAALASEVGERGGATQLIETLFAKFIAPYFRKDVGPELMLEVKEATEELDRFYKTISIPSIRDGGLRMTGAGNRYYD